MTNHLFIEFFAGTGAISLVGVVGYFLKKQNDKIEQVDGKLSAMQGDIKKEMKLTKQEVVSLFHDICHERQESCSRLMTTHVEAVKQNTTLCCHKIDSLRSDHIDYKRRQEQLNDKVKAHLAKYNNGTSHGK